MPGFGFGHGFARRRRGLASVVAALPEGENLGVDVSGTPITLGGYNATASAPTSFTATRFHYDVTDGPTTIVVRVNGVVAAAALDVSGVGNQDVSISVTAGDVVTFWIESGTPTRVLAWIDEAIVP